MLCSTGRHDWIDPVSAARCCHPQWRRELRIGSAAPGDDPAGAVRADGESMLFVWRYCAPSPARHGVTSATASLRDAHNGNGAM